MARPFRLPDLGEGIHEGEVLALLVSVGDKVKEGDPIIEVETDKAAVEIPSPFTGTVEEIMVKPGDTVKVGDTLMTFRNGLPEPIIERGPAPAPEPKAGPVPASPATRRLARELGVDLRLVKPTGPGGLVTAEDVRKSSEEGVREERTVGEVQEVTAAPETREISRQIPGEGEIAPPLPDFSKWGPIERVPVRSVRRATAKQMALAWANIPHVHNQDWIDMSRLDAFRAKHKKEIEAKGGKLTVTVFALKAVATALKMYPRFNSSYDTESGDIIIKHYFNIGVAVSTEKGLLVPVIKEVDRKSITELAIELAGLVQRTREGKASLEEMQGGTFTITNVGPMGGGFFAPIINFPEVAILGMGSTSMQPVVKKKGDDYEIVPRPMMPVVLCIDHRVLDGADAIAFLRAITQALEDPEELFITMI
ncbi:MAG: 2-oxo acid dehydrogenase subunit E2 [Deltaproteobacteria bacterium]|nr:2-oxo acid dehydrogenase subunit E2 [Deltaproteobacteria bacterium]